MAKRDDIIRQKHLGDVMTKANARLTASNLGLVTTAMKYLEQVHSWHGYIRFLGLPTLVETSKDVPLDRLYIAPHLSKSHLTPELFDDPTETLETTSLLEALSNNQRLVVLGDPGSGKSTLINYVCESLTRRDSELKRRFSQQQLIPLPFILRELGVDERVTWDSLVDSFLKRPVAQGLNRKIVNDWLRSGTAWVLLDGIDELGSLQVRERLRDAFIFGAVSYPETRFLLTSRLVGYDACPFNEVSNSAFQNLFEAEVTEWDDSSKGDLFALKTTVHSEPFIPYSSKTIIDSKAPAKLPILSGGLILSAIKGLETNRDPRKSMTIDLPCLYLAPFNDSQVCEFTQRWWNHHRANPAVAASEATEFLKALHAKDDTRTLGRVPNLLTLIALVYKVFINLPDGRADLYRRISEAYLENIDRHYKLKDRLPYSHLQMSAWLSHVAWHMQLRRYEAAIKADADDQRTNKKPASDIMVTHDQAAKCLKQGIQEVEGIGDSRAELVAETFLDYAARRSGLFVPRGEDDKGRTLYAFMHLSFQEFFAALYLLDKVGTEEWRECNITHSNDDSETSVANLQNYAARPEWQEVMVFLFEMLGDSDRGRPLSRLRVLLKDENTNGTWQDFETPFFPDEKDPEAAAAPRPPPRLKSQELVHLAALLGMNQRVRLEGAARIGLLKCCWNWEINRLIAENLVRPNIVARTLVSRRGCTELSWKALQSIGAEATHLDLADCTGITSLVPLEPLRSLRALSLEGCSNVSDLSPIKGAIDLGHLNLNGCSGITNITLLKQFPKLQKVVLRGCHGVIDITPLKALKQLCWLSLSGCTGVSNLAPLKGLGRLRVLHLSGCTGVSNFTALKDLGSLESLDLDGCTHVSDLTALKGLDSLKELSLDGCTGVSDLTALKGLGSLQSLSLNGCTGVSDLTALKGLDSLQSLSLNGCIGVSDLTALQGLGGLQSLFLFRCLGLKDKKRQIADLKKALPKCNVMPER